jgi:hypothetical protein
VRNNINCEIFIHDLENATLISILSLKTIGYLA